MATPTVYQCPLCDEFQALSYKQLLPHIRIVHASKPGFSISCGVQGCQRSFTNMKSYDNHISQHMLAGNYPSNAIVMSNNEHCSQHPEESLVGTEPGDDSPREDNFSSNEHNECTHPQANDQCTTQDSMAQPAAHFKSQAAVWILKTKECHKLTTSTMTSIIEDITAFNQIVLGKVEMAVKSALESAGIPSSNVPELSGIFNMDGVFGQPFKGLETAYLQEQYCTQKFGFVVSTVTVHV